VRFGAGATHCTRRRPNLLQKCLGKRAHSLLCCQHSRSCVGRQPDLWRSLARLPSRPPLDCACYCHHSEAALAPLLTFSAPLGRRRRHWRNVNSRRGWWVQAHALWSQDGVFVGAGGFRCWRGDVPLSSALVIMPNRPCGLMDKALVFGTKDCRFESCQGQNRKKRKKKQKRRSVPIPSPHLQCS
jgi:hypothetical protein